ncbi:hypothetical protein [Amycolatopsis granulosa]|uniref:hypothetical protein n=1 Tax=Amycolatopsis granulosa TaxID=185684 RepID=UPI001422B41B|nr:hypothetical protein [Amycolatopsis granulosa]NIH86599.1 hypothetical protein [Amycolatopsis granulosa]
MDPKTARRLVKMRKCSCLTCFYCDETLDDRHEHDHFPVPKVARGTAIVAACLDCHDLKDRILFNSWPAGACVEAVQGLLTGIELSKQRSSSISELVAWVSGNPSFADAEVLGRWATLPALTRILYGKLRSIEEERRYRTGQPYDQPSALAALLSRSPLLDQ